MWDEAIGPDGAPRPHHRRVLEHLERAGPAVLAAAVAREVRALGITSGAGASLRDFVVDPVPRVLAAAEWAPLAAGVAQRALALDRWVADAHGEQDAVRAGVVPRAVLESSRYFERDLVGVPQPVRIAMAGPDIVRAPDGTFVVLEDNVRTPTMIMVALAIRRCCAAAYGELAPSPDALEADARALMLDALAAAVPRHASDAADPCAVVLVDREESALVWELDAFGPLLGLPVVELAELAPRGDRVVLREGGRPVDVVFRRTSEERLRTDAGALTTLGALFLRPLRAQTVSVVNAFGTGVADDKRVYPYVEELVRFFCGEEPLLRSIPSRDARDPGVPGSLDGLVVKPRSGSGGFGVVIGGQAAPEQLDAVRAALRDEPDELLVQELVRFSLHPSWTGTRLESRHVDLRPYASVHDGRARVLRGGFSRMAPAAGDLVVNCSQGGGGKDVWIV